MEHIEKIQLTGAATKSIPLNIPKGYYIFWTFSTQAAFTIQCILKDDNSVYANYTRTSRNVLPPEQGYAKVAGNNLQLVINIVQSSNIDARIGWMDIRDNKQQLIAKTITLAGEDQDDFDYNDIFFNITAWRSEG